jgi:hypothetical protein
VNQSRVVMLASDSLDKMWRLAKALADRVEEEMKVEKVRLLEQAKSVTAEEWKRRIAADAPNFPGQGKVGDARGRT